MQLGLSSYTYTWAVGLPGSMPQIPISARQLIDKVADAGIGLVQIADNLPLEKWSDEQLIDLNSYARNKNIAVEMGGRGLTPEHTFKCLNTAKLIHSPILRMVIDGTGFEPDIKTISAIIKDMLPEFESKNIKLAIENHDRLRARDFEKIIQSAGSELVGICLDSVNSMGAGEGFEEVSRILLPYTINLHIKDFTIRRDSHKMGIIIEGAPAGKGMLNIKELIEKLKLLKQCESAILELWTPPETELKNTIEKEEKWAGESIKFLKTIL
jgi:sugar phosphate isomerase/epimerase